MKLTPLALRWAAHLSSGTARELLDYSVVKGAEFTTRIEARVWEQRQIIKYGMEKSGGQLQNLRNEIAQKYWPKYRISP